MAFLSSDDSSSSAPAGRNRTRKLVLVGLIAGSVVTGVSAFVLRDSPRAIVITEDVLEASTSIPSPRSRGGAPRPAASDSLEVACEGQPPGPSWGCHEGRWQMGAPSSSAAADSSMSGGGGRADRAAGCLTDQPGPSFVCDNGLWVIAGSGAGGASFSTTGFDAIGAERCPPPDPGDGWTCRDGGWVPQSSSVPMPTSSASSPLPQPSSDVPQPIPAVTAPFESAAP